MQRTCTKGPPGEEYSYECLRCEVNGAGGKDSGVVDAGERDSGSSDLGTRDSGSRDSGPSKDSGGKDPGPSKDSGTGTGPNKDSGSSIARDSGRPQSNDASARPVPTTGTPDPVVSSSGEKPPVTPAPQTSSPADTASPEGGSKAPAAETSTAGDEDDGCNVSRVNSKDGGVAAWLAFGLGLLWLARKK